MSLKRKRADADLMTQARLGMVELPSSPVTPHQKQRLLVHGQQIEGQNRRSNGITSAPTTVKRLPICD